MMNDNRLLLIDTGQSSIKELRASTNQLKNHWNFIDIVGFDDSVDNQLVTEANVTIYVPSSKITRFLWPVFVFKKGWELFLKNKYDHIIVREHPLLLSCPATLLLHKVTDKPYIVEITKPQHFLSSTGLLGKIENFLMLKFFRFEARFAKAILTLDQAGGADFIHRCSKQSGKVVCIPPLFNNNNLQENQHSQTYGATLKQLFIET